MRCLREQSSGLFKFCDHFGTVLHIFHEHFEMDPYGTL